MSNTAGHRAHSTEALLLNQVVLRLLKLGQGFG